MKKTIIFLCVHGDSQGLEKLGMLLVWPMTYKNMNIKQNLKALFILIHVFSSILILMVFDWTAQSKSLPSGGLPGRGPHERGCDSLIRGSQLQFTLNQPGNFKTCDGLDLLIYVARCVAWWLTVSKLLTHSQGQETYSSPHWHYIHKILLLHSWFPAVGFQFQRVPDLHILYSTVP